MKEVLTELNIVEEDYTFTNLIAPQLIHNDCCKRAYLRGAFLAGGSVNNPETSSYHLEIATIYKEHGEALSELINGFSLNSKTIERKKVILRI